MFSLSIMFKAKIKENIFIRIIFFKLIYIFTFFKIKRIKPKNFNNILVLGKGYSLNSLPTQIKNIDKPSLIILSNFNKKDLNDKRLLHVIRKFPVIIMGNITEPLLKFKTLQKLNIYKFYIQRIKIYSKKLGRRLDTVLNKNLSSIYSSRKNYFYDAFTNDVSYLPDYVHFFMEKLRKKRITFSFNTGLASIVLACSFNPKKIIIFGYDFYETNYYNMHLLENMEINEFKKLTSLSKKFAYTFNQILQSHAKINFYLFTKSKASIKRKNLKKILVK